MHRRLLSVLIAAGAAIGSSGCAVLQCGPGVAGCGAGIGCAVDPGCGCESGCAVEPGCGVGGGCTVAGCGGACAMAGQKWRGDCACEGPRVNVCTGPQCCGGCGDPGCGVADCGSACGCGAPVGCGDGCGTGSCGSAGYGLTGAVGNGAMCLVGEVYQLLRPICGECNGMGCGGCDSELYWSEWHNDPPQCCDPCDNHGNWVGPSRSAYRAPYDHEFSPRRLAQQPSEQSLVR